MLKQILVFRYKVSICNEGMKPNCCILITGVSPEEKNIPWTVEGSLQGQIWWTNKNMNRLKIPGFARFETLKRKWKCVYHNKLEEFRSVYRDWE